MKTINAAVLFSLCLFLSLPTFCQEFNSSQDVMQYVENKNFYNSDNGLTVSIGEISSLNTYGMTIKNKYGTTFYAINCNFQVYGLYATITGYVTTNGGTLQFRIQNDELIAGDNSTGMQHYKLVKHSYGYQEPNEQPNNYQSSPSPQPRNYDNGNTTENIDKRDPRSKDYANVFWDSRYSLHSFKSDQLITPNSQGLYDVWMATNENPTPQHKLLSKQQNIVGYKFINYNECLTFCNEVRTNKKMPLIGTSHNDRQITVQKSISVVGVYKSKSDLATSLGATPGTGLYNSLGNKYDFLILKENGVAIDGNGIQDFEKAVSYGKYTFDSANQIIHIKWQGEDGGENSYKCTLTSDVLHPLILNPVLEGDKTTFEFFRQLR